MYIVQEQAEWANNPNSIDQDFEAGTEDEAYKIAGEIVRGGSIAIILEGYREIDRLEP